MGVDCVCKIGGYIDAHVYRYVSAAKCAPLGMEWSLVLNRKMFQNKNCFKSKSHRLGSHTFKGSIMCTTHVSQHQASSTPSHLSCTYTPEGRSLTLRVSSCNCADKLCTVWKSFSAKALLICCFSVSTSDYGGSVQVGVVLHRHKF